MSLSKLTCARSCSVTITGSVSTQRRSESTLGSGSLCLCSISHLQTTLSLPSMAPSPPLRWVFEGSLSLVNLCFSLKPPWPPVELTRFTHVLAFLPMPWGSWMPFACSCGDLVPLALSTDINSHCSRDSSLRRRHRQIWGLGECLPGLWTEPSHYILRWPQS
jgi:hypothetical protein